MKHLGISALGPLQLLARRTPACLPALPAIRRSGPRSWATAAARSTALRHYNSGGAPGGVPRASPLTSSPPIESLQAGPSAAVGVVPRIGAAIPLPSEQLPANLVAQLSGDISELEGFIRATEKELRGVLAVPGDDKAEKDACIKLRLHFDMVLDRLVKRQQRLEKSRQRLALGLLRGAHYDDVDDGDDDEDQGETLEQEEVWQEREDAEEFR